MLKKLFAILLLSLSLAFIPLSKVSVGYVRETPTQEVNKIAAICTDDICYNPITGEQISGSSTDVPTDVEDYYNQNIRDQYMFGISLGTILGLLASFVSIMVQIRKSTKANRELKATSEANKQILDNILSQVDIYKSLLEEKEKALEEALASNQKIQYQYEDLMAKVSEQFSNGTKILNKYAKIDEKLNATLMSVKELASTPSNIKSGVSQKVQSIVDNVKR